CFPRQLRSGLQCCGGGTWRLPLAQFQYRAADPEGKVVEGTIEAAEAAAVVARLQDRGLIPLRVGAATDGKAKAKESRIALPSMPALRRKPGNRDLLVITQELSALLQAGLPPDRNPPTLVQPAGKA